MQHRFASHCCEALFLQSAPIVTRELLAPIKAEEETVGERDGAISMEDAFLSTVKELEGNMGYLVTDSFASHALRLLLVVLSGRPLKGTSTTSMLQSKKKERIDIKARNIESRAEDVRSRTIPESFRKALDEMVLGTVTGLSTTHIQALATHPVGNPVLQLLLELEFSTSGRAKADVETSLFRRLLPDDPPTEGTLSASFVKGLLYDPVGSRLLETIVQFAPGKSFKSLYRSMFRDNIGNIVKNDTAGYVVSRILERLSHDDLEYTVGQICPHIPMLIVRQRTSIIKTLIERCQVRQLDTNAIADAIVGGFGGHRSKVLVNMVKLSSIDSANMAPERQLQLEAQDAGRLHGSLLAQVMLSAPGELRDIIVDDIIALDTATLLVLAKDRTATHVLQSVLTCEGQAKSCRRKLVQRFFGHITDMALDAIASHVVDSFWVATEDLLFIREHIAEELQQNEAVLRESFSGRAVRRNWMMDLYSRKRIDWIAEAKATQTGDEMKRTENTTDDTVAKSGIEMARARFAAAKAAKATGNKRLKQAKQGVWLAPSSGISARG